LNQGYGILPVEERKWEDKEEINMDVGKLIKAAALVAIVILQAPASFARVEPRPIYVMSAESARALPGGESAAASLPLEVPINPEDLGKLLQAPSGEKPILIHVGFHVLYTQGHIPGSEYIGPASQEEAWQKLRKRVEQLPRKKFIVLYCGCCPWDHCPTVSPAYAALHNMGFSRVRVLYFPNNFGRDWIAKGYPVEKGQ
jgi:rhodanese-related sulfurtransferase